MHHDGRPTSRISASRGDVALGSAAPCLGSALRHRRRHSMPPVSTLRGLGRLGGGTKALVSTAGRSCQPTDPPESLAMSKADGWELPTAFCGERSCQQSPRRPPPRHNCSLLLQTRLLLPSNPAKALLRQATLFHLAVRTTAIECKLPMAWAKSLPSFAEEELRRWTSKMPGPPATSKPRTSVANSLRRSGRTSNGCSGLTRSRMPSTHCSEISEAFGRAFLNRAKFCKYVPQFCSIFTYRLQPCAKSSMLTKGLLRRDKVHLTAATKFAAPRHLFANQHLVAIRLD